MRKKIIRSVFRCIMYLMLMLPAQRGKKEESKKELFVHLHIATLFHSVDGATLWLSQYINKVSCELLEDYFPSVQNCFKIG